MKEERARTRRSRADLNAKAIRTYRVTGGSAQETRELGVEEEMIQGKM